MLAALLLDTLQLMPERTKTKYVLHPPQNRDLSTWQREHLKLSWAEHGQPSVIEDAVIAALGPPLNLAGNAAHAFHSTLSEARTRFRGASRPKA